MGMSCHIAGFIPADETWNQYKAIWDSCKQVGIHPPDEVLKFFNWEYPGDNPGKQVDNLVAVQEWSNEYYSGYQIEIDKLPPEVKFIRAYISW